MDWSDFAAPLEFTVSDSGTVEEAYRSEPLASDLLALLRGSNIETLASA